MAGRSDILLLYSWPTPLWQKLWTFIKIFIKEGLLHGQWSALFFWRRVGGQYTLPRNVQLGLEQLAIPYQANVFATDAVFETCYVLRDARCLRWAIEQRRLGRIGKLIAGPMIVNFPFEKDGLVENKWIDTFLLPSDWTKQLFTRLGKSKDVNYQVWPLGIDCQFWQPSSPMKGRTWLVYVKNPEAGLLNAVVEALRARKLNVKVLKAGTFTAEEYRSDLRQAAAVVFLSRSESQGLAMFEAWACDVASLHWNPGEVQLLQHRYEGASSCPYLTEACGMDFANIASFDKVLDLFLKRLPQFKPRSFVVPEFELRQTVSAMLKFRDIQ